MSDVDAFRATMRRAGLDFGGPILADGRLHRFKAEGDHAANSWYVLHADAPVAGAFGCWRRGVKDVWHARDGTLNQADWSPVRRRWAEAEAAAERDKAERQAKARQVAANVLAKAGPTGGHAYLSAKGVQSHGELRQYCGRLVVPLRDVEGALHSLQFVGPDGTKRFLPGGRVSGCFFALADRADGPLVIAEGVATGASIHEATAYAVVCAMHCGNLLAMAKALRDKWPERELILAADNDAWTQGNPGLSDATAAAKAVGAKLAVPRFEDTGTKPTDFNDMARLEGLDAVRAQIEAATAPKETDQDTFARLAKLSRVDYDRQRELEAKRLGIRVGTLDSQVEVLRTASGRDEAQGAAVTLPDVEPWPDPVHGAEVLGAASATFTRYVALPPGAADALALWTAHSHCYIAFGHTPRLSVCSPEKRCGKSTLLDVLATLAPRPVRVENMTCAVLFRIVQSHKPTLLLDEVDTYLHDNEELRGLLNSGHARNGKTMRCEGETFQVRAFATFAPAALAGIGGLPGTLHDRSIVIRLVRAKPGEVSTRFDSRHVSAETELCRRLARWASDHTEALGHCDPRLPGGAFNRLADNWRPLLAIAEVAGGDWPLRAAEAFATLTGGEDMDAQGTGTTLLADIKGIFSRAGVDQLPSAKLAAELAAIEGRPWKEFGKPHKEISANQLANQLRKFGIGPRGIRVGDDTPRGYVLTDFSEAFNRFLAPPRFPECNNATSPANITDSSVFKTQQPKPMLHSENAVSPNKDGPCCIVAFRKPGEPGELALAVQEDLL